MESKNYQVEVYHLSNPPWRWRYPQSPNDLYTLEEAEEAAKKEREKGYMIAWVVKHGK